MLGIPVSAAISSEVVPQNSIHRDIWRIAAEYFGPIVGACLFVVVMLGVAEPCKSLKAESLGAAASKLGDKC